MLTNKGHLKKIMNHEKFKKPWIMITGGLGYIGSHIVAALLESKEFQDRDFVFMIFDNESTVAEPRKVIETLENWNETAASRLVFYKGDVRDPQALKFAFDTMEFQCECVIHCAGVKAAGESVRKPLKYYSNNVVGSLTLLRLMQDNQCVNFIFSSSATVYGEPQHLPLTEKHPIAPINPYGQSKAMVEKIARDWHAVAPTARQVLLLRYMNPVGAHHSARLGETPNGEPQNLMPYVADVALGKRSHVNVFGEDYATRDGTGIRDYIHIEDLALAHVEAAALICTTGRMGTCRAVNVGRGEGVSVLEMIKAFSKASGRKIHGKIVERRAGDAAEVYCDNSEAKALLPRSHSNMKGVEEMCASAWRFISQQ